MLWEEALMHGIWGRFLGSPHCYMPLRLEHPSPFPLVNPQHRSGSRFPSLQYFDCVDHNKLWKILKEMGIPDHFTCLLRNLHAG